MNFIDNNIEYDVDMKLNDVEDDEEYSDDDNEVEELSDFDMEEF